MFTRTQDGSFSWQVTPNLRIGAVRREPGSVDVALFEGPAETVAGSTNWTPDRPLDRDHGMFEALQRHCGSDAPNVLGILNAEAAQLATS
jgi:hypothetical protein